MKNLRIDLKSLIIGVLGTLLTLTLMGAKEAGTGHMVVNSLTVKDSVVVVNKDGKTVVFLGNMETGGGVQTFNFNGRNTSFLGTASGGNGGLTTYNFNGLKTAYLGSDPEGDGFARTFNRDEKITSYLGTSESGNGHLGTFNSEGIRTAYIGTGIHKGGAIILKDPKGKDKWGKQAK